MKCLDCPLCVSDYCDACGDGDIYCLITRGYAKDEGGCRRTNKFIFAQNIQKLKDEWAEEEARKWADMADWLDEQDAVEEASTLIGIDTSDGYGEDIVESED